MDGRFVDLAAYPMLFYNDTILVLGSRVSRFIKNHPGFLFVDLSLTVGLLLMGVDG